jgi:predicted dehydrogenase
VTKPPVRVAFIGAGRIADLHALGYRDNPTARLVAVCDADAAWATRRAEEWGAESVYSDYRETLADDGIDAVEILTPHEHHMKMTVEALTAGKHVSVQKPMARTMAEAQVMREAAERSRAVFRVLENFRYYPPYVLAKRMLDAGEIGDPVSLRVKVIGGNPEHGWRVPLKSWAWRVDEAASGGGPAMFDHGYHIFSLVRWLFGPVQEVFAWIERTEVAPGITFDSPAALVWKHEEGGRFGSWETVNLADLVVRSKYYSNDEWLEVTGTRGLIWVTRCSGEMLDAPPVIVYRDGETREIRDVETDWAASFVAGARDWHRAILEGGPPPELTAEEGAEVLRFSLAAHHSAREGRPVRVSEIA